MSKAAFYHAPVRAPKVYEPRRRANPLVELRPAPNRAPATHRNKPTALRRVALARMAELK